MECIAEEGKASVRLADVMDEDNFCSLAQPQSKKEDKQQLLDIFVNPWGYKETTWSFL